MKYEFTGVRFGRLVAMSRTELPSRRSAWLCVCDCGAEKIVSQINLRTGKTSSCGCLIAEKLSAGLAGKKHGLSRTPEHKAWTSLRERCSNPSLKSYHRYGGRGISVCARWDEFQNFLEDMGPRPSPYHSIDRIDVNGNYEPGNCRWATSSTQGNNRENNRHIEVNGVTMTHVDAASLLGVPYGALRKASAKPGFDPVQFSRDFKPGGPVSAHQIKTVLDAVASGLSTKEAAAAAGCSVAKVCQIKNGRDSKWMPFDYASVAAAASIEPRGATNDTTV